MIREILYAFVAFVLLAYLLDFLFSLGDDAREPPRLYSKFPLLGHPIGFMLHNRGYFSHTSKRTDAEIYTLGVFNFKLYICVSNRLLSAVQKESKTLSFSPFVQLAQHTLGNATPETYKLFGGEMLGDLTRVTRSTLAPGPHLDGPNMRMGMRVLRDIDDLLNPSQTSVPERHTKLLEWARHAIVQASCCAVYGEDHPFLDPEVEQALWIWQAYIPAHFLGTDIFGTGYAQRQKVFNALIKYYKSFPSEDASKVARERWRVLREAGIEEVEAAKQEVSLCIGMTGNTVPTFYWVIWELFSRPSLLEEVRQELQTNATSGTKKDGFVFDVAALKSRCPLLLSVIEETQRHHHIHATVRKIMADTTLDGKYLLKAGNYLQIPGNPFHMNTGIWGTSAAQFDPYRFLPQKQGDRSTHAPHAPGTASAFLAWGAPPNLCPARQFAATEVMIMVALLAIRAEIHPASGVWEKNPEWNHNELHSVLNPKVDATVYVSKRSQWAGKWSLKMGESKSRVSLTSG